MYLRRSYRHGHQLVRARCKRHIIIHERPVDLPQFKPPYILQFLVVRRSGKFCVNRISDRTTRSHTCLQNFHRRQHSFTQHSTLVSAATDVSAVCVLDCKRRAGRACLQSSVLTFSHCMYRIPCRSSGFILFVLHPLPQWLHLYTVLACQLSFQPVSSIFNRTGASLSANPVWVQAHQRRHWRRHAEIEHRSAIREHTC